MLGRGSTKAVPGAGVRARRGAFPVLFALAFAVVAGFAWLLAATAHAQDAREYRFIKVMDSAEDGFHPSPVP